MDTHDLDALLNATASRELPACPPWLEARVLSQVRASDSTTTDSVWKWLDVLLAKSSFLAAAAVFTLAISSVVTTASVASAPDVERREQLSRALGFESLTQPQFVSLNHNRHE